MGISEFYKSKVRQRRWGTPCMKCRRYMDKGEECMRQQLDYNSYGCMQYNEYCMKCYKKIYKSEIKKEIKEAEKSIKYFQNKIISLRGEIS